MPDKTIKTHGTPSGYFNGCDCAECKAAGKKYRTEGSLELYRAGKARKQPLFHPEDREYPYDPADPRHGSLSAYTQGCRCVWCRKAGAYYRSCKKLGIPFPTDYNARTNSHEET